MIDYYEPKLDLTLLGCGFLGTYHLGAIYLLNQVWPQKPYNRICGASCGGLIGAILLVGIKLDHALADALDIIRQLRRILSSPARRLTSSGSCASVGELVERKLEQILPPNAHQLCSGRLGISVTKLWSFENVILSNFCSRRDLIDAVCAGCFIPIWSGCLRPPSVRGRPCIDGAYSNNSPKFAPTQGDERAHQVLISPFSSDADVSPQGETYLFKSRVMGNLYLANWNNFLRTTHAMIPFSLDKYRVYFVGGHHDMKDFLLRNNMIQCRECRLARAQGPVMASSCLSCLRLLERVDSLRVPQRLLATFDN